MAIRKLRKQMKPLIFLFVAAFIITILGGVYAYVYQLKSSKEQRLAFKLNGETVEITKVERAFASGLNNYKQTYGDKISDDEIKTLMFNNVVEQELLGQEAKKLKVKVSGKEVDAEYDSVAAGFPDKDQFKRALQQQGYTRSTLKTAIKESLLLEAVRAKIEDQASVNDADIEGYYEDNKYGAYLGKTLDEAKEEIKEKLENSEKSKVYNAYMEKLMQTATYSDMKETYAPYQYAIAYEGGDFKFSNVEVLNRVIIQKFYGIADVEEAEKNAMDSLESEVKFAAKAVEMGAVLNKELAVVDQLNDLREQLEKIMMEKAEVIESDVMYYFAQNEVKYQTKETADIELIEFDLAASDEDKAASKARAEEILAKAKEMNVGITEFAEMAKEFSEGPSASFGGDLGWFPKEKMVAEFADAAFAAEKETLIDKVVETQFGYHLIYVEDKKEEDGVEQVKASHILIQDKVGEATVAKVVETAEEVKARLENNEMKFADAVSENSKLQDSSINKIERGAYIPGIGYDKGFGEAIFAAELDKYTIYSADRVILFKKTNYVAFEEADYSKIKDRVKYDYLKEKINKEMSELITE